MFLHVSGPSSTKMFFFKFWLKFCNASFYLVWILQTRLILSKFSMQNYKVGYRNLFFSSAAPYGSGAFPIPTCTLSVRPSSTFALNANFSKTLYRPVENGSSSGKNSDIIKLFGFLLTNVPSITEKKFGPITFGENFLCHF